MELLRFLWYEPEHAAEQTVESPPVILTPWPSWDVTVVVMFAIDILYDTSVLRDYYSENDNLARPCWWCDKLYCTGHKFHSMKNFQSTGPINMQDRNVVHTESADILGHKL